MHELKLLIVVTLAIGFSVTLSLRYFLAVAKRDGADKSNAIAKGMLAALVVFAVFIVIYENVREKKTVEGDSAWCEEHPANCRPFMFDLFKDW